MYGPQIDYLITDCVQTEVDSHLITQIFKLEWKSVRWKGMSAGGPMWNHHSSESWTARRFEDNLEGCSLLHQTKSYCVNRVNCVGQETLMASVTPLTLLNFGFLCSKIKSYLDSYCAHFWIKESTVFAFLSTFKPSVKEFVLNIDRYWC